MMSMSILFHPFKHIVAAFVLTVGVSIPLGAFSQEIDAEVSRLDELYGQLLAADDSSAAQIDAQIYTEWSKSGSAAMDLLLQRGLGALETGELEAAVEHYTALVDHAPGFAEAYNGRATAYFQLGLLGPSLDDLREVLVLEPRHFGAMTGLAVIFEQINRPEEALAAYQEVLKLYPLEPNVLDAIQRLETQVEGRDI
jgi:tetratricopeptide (TPR) repeat protein